MKKKTALRQRQGGRRGSEGKKDDNKMTRQTHLELWCAYCLAKGWRKFAGAARRHTGIWMLTAAAVVR